jgi:hypothetical protein
MTQVSGSTRERTRDRDRLDGGLWIGIALGRHDPSPRFKQVVQPTPKHWLQHLELRDAREIDAQVVAWRREAADRAT